MNRKTIDLATAAAVLGKTTNLPDVSNMDQPYAQEAIDKHTIQMLADGVNKEAGFTPDWDDTDQDKFEPRFCKDKTGRWVFDDHGGGIWCTYSSLGSRLVFGTREDCRYFGELVVSLGLMK